MTDNAVQLTNAEIEALASARAKERLRGELERLDRKIDALRSQLAEAEQARAELLHPSAPAKAPKSKRTPKATDSTDGDEG